MLVTTSIAVYRTTAHITQTRESNNSQPDIEVRLPTGVLSHTVVALDHTGNVVPIVINLPLSVHDEINGPTKPVGTIIYNKHTFRGRLLA